MECTIDWGGPSGMLFVAKTGSGHIATMDGAPEGGGHNLAPRPMEMLLIGTGGCIAYDVVLILKRGRHAVERAVQLSHEKYCSASAILEKTAELTFSIDIIDSHSTA